MANTNTKFDTNIFISDRDMTQKSKPKMAAAAMLNFDKTVIFGPSDPCIANIYLQTKFDAN